MDWSDLKDRFEPLNQHVSLGPDRKQQIRARLHAEIKHMGEEQPLAKRRRRHKRVVTAGSLGAALVAVVCFAAVIDYSQSNHHGSNNGPLATGPTGTSSSDANASSGGIQPNVQANSKAGPAQGLTTQSTNSTSSGISNSVMQLQSPAVQLNADTPLQMFGQYGWMLGKSGLLHTTDGGKTWSAVKVPLPSKPFNQVFTVLNGQSAVVAAGVVSGSHASTLVYRTQDGGHAWQKTQMSENLPGQNAGQVPKFITFSGAKNGWMTTSVPDFGMGGVSPGGLYQTKSGAESWQRVTPTGFPKGTVAFDWLSFVTPQIGFTEGAPQANADAGVTTGQYKLYRTTDGGSSWSAANISIAKAKRVNILEPQFTGSIGYLPVVVDMPNGSVQLEIFKSTDFGATWKNVYGLEAQHGGKGPAISVSPGAFWVYYDGALWVSTDGGQSFTEAPKVPGQITELDMTSATSGYAVTVKPLPGTAGETHILYQTADGGKTWTKTSTQP